MAKEPRPQFGWLMGWRLHSHGWMRLYKTTPWDDLGNIRWGPARDFETGRWR